MKSHIVFSENPKSKKGKSVKKSAQKSTKNPSQSQKVKTTDLYQECPEDEFYLPVYLINQIKVRTLQVEKIKYRKRALNALKIN